MDTLYGFIVAGLALAGSPGPATLSLAAASAAFGARRAVGYLVGIVLGMVAVMAVTAAGLVGLFLTLPAATAIVTVAAMVYFVWLAWRIATAPPLTDAACQRRLPRFQDGLGLSLINPKGYAAMATLFSGFVLVKERLELDTALKVALLTLLIAVVNVVWLLAGVVLTRLFRDPRTNRVVNIAFAVALLASVVLALRA